ncbi:uncharacterized protein LOC105682111 [Bombus impatiens]|uniref:Uncharacterized protein LOC105682111 n=1 Tax=Bombus impatiens TaxID=132113 RepID=A0A6P3V768_BOMIM|nr:uncharacterized protein LOC105682111 [Bombus impatiens]
MVGNTLFAYQELSTNVIEIEASLKFRPLIPLLSDPNDLSPLTRHFLKRDSLTSTPECNLTTLKTGRLSAWQKIKLPRQHWWSIWNKEYLNQHQHGATKSKESMMVISRFIPRVLRGPVECLGCELFSRRSPNCKPYVVWEIPTSQKIDVPSVLQTEESKILSNVISNYLSALYFLFFRS